MVAVGTAGQTVYVNFSMMLDSDQFYCSFQCLAPDGTCPAQNCTTYTPLARPIPPPFQGRPVSLFAVNVGSSVETTAVGGAGGAVGIFNGTWAASSLPATDRPVGPDDSDVVRGPGRPAAASVVRPSLPAATAPDRRILLRALTRRGAPAANPSLKSPLPRHASGRRASPGPPRAPAHRSPRLPAPELPRILPTASRARGAGPSGARPEAFPLAPPLPPRARRLGCSS